MLTRATSMLTWATSMLTRAVSMLIQAASMLTCAHATELQIGFAGHSISTHVNTSSKYNKHVNKLDNEGYKHVNTGHKHTGINTGSKYNKNVNTVYRAC